jgi:hypothetical protein
VSRNEPLTDRDHGFGVGLDFRIRFAESSDRFFHDGELRFRESERMLLRRFEVDDLRRSEVGVR